MMGLRSFCSLALAVPILGCSNHPLPNGVTGYTSAQLVEKLRCEAQEAVLFHLGINGWRDAQARRLAAQKQIDFLKNENKDIKDKYDKFVKITEQLKNSLKLLKISEKNTNSEINIIDENVLAIIKQIIASEDKSYIKVLTKKRNELGRDKTIKMVKLKKNKKDIVFINNKLSEILFSNANANIILNNKLTKQAEKILSDNQKTESLRNLSIFNKISIAIELKFKITESNDAVGALGLKWLKLRKVGEISLTLDASRKKKRDATRVINTNSTFMELSDQEKLECNHDQIANRRGRARTYPLVGKVGIDEFIDQYIQITSSTNVDSTDSTFTDLLEFTTALTAGINPTIKIMKISPQLVNGSIDLDATRMDVHTVTVQLQSNQN